MDILIFSRNTRGKNAYITPAGILVPIGEENMGRRWTTIKVPEEVANLIRSLRQRTGKSSWQIIVESLSFYDNMLREQGHFSKSSNVDKAAYYILKLITSASYVKFSKYEESLEKFKQVVGQVSERLNISCQELIPAAEKLIKEKSGKSIHTFNMVLKSCIIKLIFKMLEN